MAELADKCEEMKVDGRSDLTCSIAKTIEKKYNLNPDDYNICNHPRGVWCRHYSDLLRLTTFGLCRKK